MSVVAVLVAVLLVKAGVLDGAITAFQSAFRADDHGIGGDSLRSRGWALVIQEMTIKDWIFGLGLNHWGEFFRDAGGLLLLNPHSYLITIPGTYGLTGVILYLVLAKQLLGRVMGSEPAIKAAAWMFLIQFFVTDAVTVPHLLGNTALTFLIWLGLGVVLSEDRVTAATKKEAGIDSDTRQT
jgi:hypothetical protein